MDEVGFMVRSISNLGLIHLMVVGGVKPIAQHQVRLSVFRKAVPPARLKLLAALLFHCWQCRLHWIAFSKTQC
jgi:hypothetical protein